MEGVILQEVTLASELLVEVNLCLIDLNALNVALFALELCEDVEEYGEVALERGLIDADADVTTILVVA